MLLLQTKSFGFKNGLPSGLKMANQSEWRKKLPPYWLVDRPLELTTAHVFNQNAMFAKY